ncbi:hypothetical protein [Streptomyces sp. NPDC001307]
MSGARARSRTTARTQALQPSLMPEKDALAVAEVLTASGPVLLPD